jgi:hypothetical protein
VRLHKPQISNTIMYGLFHMGIKAKRPEKTTLSIHLNLFHSKKRANSFVGSLCCLFI